MQSHSIRQNACKIWTLLRKLARQWEGTVKGWLAKQEHTGATSDTPENGTFSLLCVYIAYSSPVQSSLTDSCALLLIVSAAERTWWSCLKSVLSPLFYSLAPTSPSWIGIAWLPWWGQQECTKSKSPHRFPASMTVFWRWGEKTILAKEYLDFGPIFWRCQWQQFWLYCPEISCSSSAFIAASFAFALFLLLSDTL